MEMLTLLSRSTEKAYTEHSNWFTSNQISKYSLTNPKTF